MTESRPSRDPRKDLTDGRRRQDEHDGRDGRDGRDERDGNQIDPQDDRHDADETLESSVGLEGSDFAEEDSDGDRDRDRRRRGPTLPLLVLAVSALVAWLLWSSRPEVVKEPKPRTVPVVETLTVAPRSEPVVVRSQGTVAPRAFLQLTARVPGTVAAIAPQFVDGGVIERGDVLVEIDRRDFEIAVTRARAQVARAEVAVLRLEAEAELAVEEWNSLDFDSSVEPDALTLKQPQLAEARAALGAAEADLEKAQLDLSRTRVSAPYRGRIRETRVERGQYVAPGTPIAVLYPTNRLEVVLPIEPDDLGFLSPSLLNGRTGTPAEDGATEVLLHADLAGAPRTWPARLDRTLGSIDERTRLFSVVATLVDPDPANGSSARTGAEGTADKAKTAMVAPPIGLFVEAEIRGRVLEDVAVIPRSALHDPDSVGLPTGETPLGSMLVAVLDAEDRLVWRAVTVLRRERDRALIRTGTTGGVGTGDRIVVSRLETMVEGMQVRVVEGPSGTTRAGDGAGESAP